MTRAEQAVALKHTGCNCAQAVLCAFADKTGLPAETLKKIGAGLGAGMGCMEGTCGALCAAEILLGLATYAGKPVMKDAASIHRQFQEQCGASLCKDLKGRDTGTVLCSCDDCVRNAVRIAKDFISE
ncbi:MAG: C_GCAxxG_C_C family protein [Eubacterium sp.]|nr:C_GCAxxG_C_C family protein [Eubacterium sp.]